MIDPSAEGQATGSDLPDEQGAHRARCAEYPMEHGTDLELTRVCHLAMSDDLRLACASIEDVELFEYQLSVSVTKVPALELPGL